MIAIYCCCARLTTAVDIDIEAEVMGFYHKLLGSAAPSLPVVDIGIIRNSAQVKVDDAAMLVRQVTRQEIDKALCH